MKQALIAIVILAVLAVAATFIADWVRTPGADREGNGALAAHFEERMIALGVEDIGQPIEGFDAGLLIMAYPGLVPADFEGVETLEGYYQVNGSEIALVRTEGMPVSSAERMVSSAGYATLLANVSTRLAVVVDSEAEVDALIELVNTAERIEAKIDQGGSAFGVKVVPLAVLEDSRCPQDVQCIQAGTVRVKALLTVEGGQSTEEEFIFGEEVLPDDTREIELMQVYPEPTAGEPIDDSDYFFVFEVRRE